MKRVLEAADPNPELNFWRLIHGNQLDVSVLEWCKVFGSDSETTHWKNIVPSIEHDQFRTELLQYLGKSRGEFDQYWKSMKQYRDRQVAHYEELPPGTNYPILDSAITSAYFYYKYLITELRVLGNNNYPDDLEEYCSRFIQQTNEITEKLIAATLGRQEKVW